LICDKLDGWLDVWLSGLMGYCVDGWLDGFFIRWMGGWKAGRMFAWVLGIMSDWVDE
jgi:hypothetical protein